MTYIPIETQFPIQYGFDLVEKLNYVYNRTKGITNNQLEKIGKEISPHIIHTLHDITADGYTWFGGLEYSVRSGLRKVGVKILFPWCQSENPDSRLNRSVTIYSTRKLSTRRLNLLVDEITNHLRSPDVSKALKTKLPFQQSWNHLNK